MYLNYLKEREDAFIIENPVGFLIYRVTPDHLFISDVYIKPECRRHGGGFALADDAEVIANEKGLSYITCQADITSNNVEGSIQTILKYGFKLHSLDGNMINFVKDV